MKLSVLVLVKNEEEMIEGALSQLGFADEIVILDQNSNDNTISIAKKFTDKIYTSKSENFSSNRNMLAQKAKGDWILYLDADERLSREGKSEILEIISNNKNFTAYYFPRENYILGKRVKHGGFYPDYVPRLFKKKSLISWVGEVHESPKISGKFGYVNHSLKHLTARSLNSMIEKSAKWAKIEAKLYSKSSNPKITIVKLITSSVKQFLNRYFYKLGFLDGKIGLISATYQALHSAMIFTYLWEIQNETEKKFIKAQDSI